MAKSDEKTDRWRYWDELIGFEVLRAEWFGETPLTKIKTIDEYIHSSLANPMRGKSRSKYLFHLYQNLLEEAQSKGKIKNLPYFDEKNFVVSFEGQETFSKFRVGLDFSKELSDQPALQSTFFVDELFIPKYAFPALLRFLASPKLQEGRALEHNENACKYAISYLAAKYGFPIDNGNSILAWHEALYVKKYVELNPGECHRLVDHMNFDFICKLGSIPEQCRVKEEGGVFSLINKNPTPKISIKFLDNTPSEIKEALSKAV